eukprot:GHVU01004756.1.p1 GENE.GHVU01004756.1~~GHVU01004756.1.p1  ORF type:complete len:127 (-),score=10.00 GHVU01004756.1:127-507(-)
MRMQKIQEGGAAAVLPERTTEGNIRGVGSRGCLRSRRWAFVITVSESGDKLIRSPCTREPTGTRSVPPFTDQPSSSPIVRVYGVPGPLMPAGSIRTSPSPGNLNLLLLRLPFPFVLLLILGRYVVV